jgi:hypothetical protein
LETIENLHPAQYAFLIYDCFSATWVQFTDDLRFTITFITALPY